MVNFDLFWLCPATSGKQFSEEIAEISLKTTE
jgi:hypothetical protein